MLVKLALVKINKINAYSWQLIVNCITNHMIIYTNRISFQGILGLITLVCSTWKQTAFSMLNRLGQLIPNCPHRVATNIKFQFSSFFHAKRYCFPAFWAWNIYYFPAFTTENLLNSSQQRAIMIYNHAITLPIKPCCTTNFCKTS